MMDSAPLKSVVGDFVLAQKGGENSAPFSTVMLTITMKPFPTRKRLCALTNKRLWLYAVVVFAIGGAKAIASLNALLLSSSASSPLDINYFWNKSSIVVQQQQLKTLVDGSISFEDRDLRSGGKRFADKLGGSDQIEGKNGGEETLLHHYSKVERKEEERIGHEFSRSSNNGDKQSGSGSEANKFRSISAASLKKAHFTLVNKHLPQFNSIDKPTFGQKQEDTFAKRQKAELKQPRASELNSRTGKGVKQTRSTPATSASGSGPAPVGSNGLVLVDLSGEQNDELINFLAEFYAHREVLFSQAKEFVNQQNLTISNELENLLKSSKEEEEEEEEENFGEDNFAARRKFKAKPLSDSSLNLELVKSVLRMYKADHESLMQWLRQKQKGFPTLNNTTFELLDSYPNRSINVCKDGHKIWILPDGKDILHCYTRQQWIEKLWSDIRLSAFHYPIIVLNVLIFLIGTTGNIFVCLSVYRNHQLRNVTNYFIVNLAFADFLVILICLPATGVWDLTLTWFFGTIPCKLIMFLQDVSISVSVLTLTAISLDRYYAICHPLKFKTNLSQAKRIIVLIWIVSLIIMVPDLIYLSAKESQELSEAGLDTVLYSDCNYSWSSQCSSIFQFIKTILLYLIPLILMFCAHYTIMQTLKVASTSCYNELQSMKQMTTESADGQRRLANRWSRPQSQHITSSTSDQQRQQSILMGKRRRFSQRINGYATNGVTNSRRAFSNDEPTIDTNNELRNGTGTGSGNGVRSLDLDKRCENKNEEAEMQLTTRQIRFSDVDITTKTPGPKMASTGTGSLPRPEEVTSGLENSPPKSLNNQKQHKLKLINKRLVDLMARYSIDSQPVCSSLVKQQQQQQQIKTIAQNTHQDSNDFSLETNVDCCAEEPAAMGQLLVTIHNRNRIESRRKAASMLAAIVVIFGICYLPVHLINFLRQFIEDIPQTDVTSTISMLSHCACYLNSAINPIIYNHMNSTFRAEFRKFLSCLCLRKRRKKRHRFSLISSRSNNSNIINTNNHLHLSQITNDDDNCCQTIRSNDDQQEPNDEEETVRTQTETLPISVQCSIKSKQSTCTGTGTSISGETGISGKKGISGKIGEISTCNELSEPDLQTTVTIDIEV